MDRKDIKAGDLILWKGPTWIVNPVLRRVSEVRENCVYFEEGLPNGLATCAFEHISAVPTNFKYSHYPIQQQ